MKYLIQNRKEFAISVGFFLMTAFNLYKAVRSKDITEDLIIAVIYGFFGVMAWFYNMPTSEENCVHTGKVRYEKAVKAGKITSENYEIDDFEEEGEEDA